ncbi:acyltransferase family protein [Hymenobacter crusticola]|uniref:Acyltransferase 3 domain-containing protein n=1 Tax=Hymenobacter crusticola TaxID=1770526 RepID=A0A243WH56_9BACT|nr:acyltransferase family protein [Hymenobacter crusticola]OUJ74868.1 hypothetical protein BXP70_08950 [Hymenobacter crusticola]
MLYEKFIPANGVTAFLPVSSLTTDATIVKKTTVDSQQSGPSTQSKWFGGLNSIRFVLAFIVVLSHLGNPIAIALRHSNLKLLQYVGMLLGVSFVGVSAVIAFFVISGFVIHYPNRNGIRDVKLFYVKRLVRVLVPLLVIMLAGMPFGNPERAVVWSLYCELIYYAIYPTLAKINTAWRVKLIFAFIVAAILIGTVGQPDLVSMLAQSDRGYMGDLWRFGFKLTWLVGLPYWLLGVMMAEKIDFVQQRVSTQRIWLWRIGLYAATVVCCTLRFHSFVPYSLSMLIMAAPIAKWLEQEIIYYRTKQPTAWLENFGKFSYSLYLCHPLIITALLTFVPLTVYSYLGYLMVCVVGAYLFYLLLEKPSHLLAEKLAGSLKKM